MNIRGQLAKIALVMENNNTTYSIIDGFVSRPLQVVNYTQDLEDLIIGDNDEAADTKAWIDSLPPNIKARYIKEIPRQEAHWDKLLADAAGD